jgi:hypothetical protein
MEPISHKFCSTYQLYFTLPKVHSSHECVTKNIQFSSKPPVTMNSVFLDTIPPLTHSTINFGGSAYSLVTSQSYALCNASHEPTLIKIPASRPYRIHCMQNKCELCHNNLPKHKERCAKWQKHWARAPKPDIDK